jgi:hypothetical protein
MPLKQVVSLNIGKKRWQGWLHSYLERKEKNLFHYVQDVHASMAIKFLQVLGFPSKYENEVSLFYDAASD